MLQFDTGKAKLDYLDISDPFFESAIQTIRPHTLMLNAGVEAAWALYRSIAYIVRNRVPGDIVECGVWSGGAMLLAAMALRHLGDTSRRIWLYDTFAGIPRPDPIDRRWDGVPALPTWEHHQRQGRAWCYGGSVDHVRAVVAQSGYPIERFVFVEGKVEDTLPGQRPERASLVRLDTDLYASTAHELEHLYPVLAERGILMIDDYGNYQGARAATDRFIEENGLPLFLARIDAAVRLAVKPAA